MKPRITLARKITARTDELATALARAATPDAVSAARTHMGTLRADAYLAYLDGKAARSRALYGEADRLSRKLP